MFNEQEANTFVCCLENDYQLCLRCFVNADWDISDDIIPKDILYGELIAGKRDLGRTQLRNRVMKKLNIDLSKWDEIAMDLSKRSYLQVALNERYNH